ncbi:MAG: DUF885 domain-containing protein, partial [Gammaproteobacteria bacterium]|nr:DUF885 domain-containing protein [Gammaproteobacteria bacterium]
MKKSLLSIAVLIVLTACSESGAPAQVATPPAADTAVTSAQAETQQLSETQRLTHWLDEEFAEELSFSPQWRTRLGDKTDYDKLDDVSEAAMDRELEWRRASVAEMRANFDYDALDEDGKTSWDTWQYSLDRMERSEPFRRHAYIFGRGGPHASLPNFMINFHRVDEASDMEAYITRLTAIDDVLGQYLQRTLRAVEAGIRQPRFAYDYAIAEIDRVTKGAPFTEDGISPLWNDIESKINALVENEQIDQSAADDMLNRARAALVQEVKPAYDEVLAWLHSDRGNTPEESQGVWALPD